MRFSLLSKVRQTSDESDKAYCLQRSLLGLPTPHRIFPNLIPHQYLLIALHTHLCSLSRRPEFELRLFASARSSWLACAVFCSWEALLAVAVAWAGLGVGGVGEAPVSARCFSLFHFRPLPPLWVRACGPASVTGQQTHEGSFPGVRQHRFVDIGPGRVVARYFTESQSPPPPAAAEAVV